MWTTVHRARRRFRHDGPPANDRSAPGPAEPVSDVLLALSRPELERLIRALGESLANSDRPDTPARLEAALNMAIAHRTGRGSPHVLRSPAALHTPEAWQLRIEGIDAATHAALERAIRGGSFA
jgi:hypothetical protein